MYVVLRWDKNIKLTNDRDALCRNWIVGVSASIKCDPEGEAVSWNWIVGISASINCDPEAGVVTDYKKNMHKYV